MYATALGCKLNQSEAESWSRELADVGCELVRDAALADLCIVNTCCVTSMAARRSRQAVRRCTRANPDTSVVVTGCYAEVDPSAAALLPGVSSVLRMTEKDSLVQIISHQWGLPEGRTTSAVTRSPRASSFQSDCRHTRAFVKVQDGCDNTCAYCVVRIARGRHRSRPMREIVDEVLLRQDEGYQETVLTGVNIGAYGLELGYTLHQLLSTILARTKLPRIRLTSIEPWDLGAELLALWNSPRLCRHLHLPLQSGCDATLQRMNRRYTVRQFGALVDQVRRAIPEVAITTDVIVGFPGEDEAEFSSSMEYVEDLEFARIHVFPFSARPRTPAACMPRQVSPGVKRQRMRLMTELAGKSEHAFARGFVGRTMNVLWESATGNRWSGLTDNYLRVWTETHEHLHNRLLSTRLSEVTSRGLRGVLLAPDTPQNAFG